MFDSPEIKQYSEKEEKLESAIDIIREKYGSSIVNRAVLIKRHDSKT
jgi:Na+/proline symporter